MERKGSEEVSFKYLGEKIRRMRCEKHMTQSGLADGFITRNMLSRIENGSALPSVPTICYIAKKLGIPAGYFITDDDNGDIYTRGNIISEIKRLYLSGEYKSCLTECAKISGTDDEINLISAECFYHVAVEDYRAGRLKAAKKSFMSVLDCLGKTIYSSDKLRMSILHIKLIDAFLQLTEQGNDENIFDTVTTVQDLAADISHLGRIGRMLAAGKNPEAKEFLSTAVFYTKEYRICAEAMIKSAEGANAEAKAMLASLLESDLDAMLRCKALFVMEKCCIKTNDYEGAYKCSTQRRELTRKMSR